MSGTTLARRSSTLAVASLFFLAGVAADVAAAQGTPSLAQVAPNQTCAFVTPANAEASWDNGLTGTPNIQHDGSAVPGVPLPDISRGFQGIPRSAQPVLTASQRRILECSYRLPEANADVPYTLFVPSTYDAATPNALIVDLHGLDVSPLMQILFDGTTDLAEEHGFIVVAPMGLNLRGWWGTRAGNAAPNAQTNPATGTPYTTGELSELDAMRLLSMIRERYNIDPDRIYLMGHSMGGGGTYHIGAKYADVWAGIAPLSGAGGIASAEAARAYLGVPVLLMHGELDTIVSPNGSRRSAMYLQEVGAQHLYLETPGADHEFWIRRGAENMEKVFLFFSTVSKATNRGPITPDMIPAQGGG